MKESEIRQKDLMQRYIELSGEDVKHFFSVGGRREIPCVACGSMDMSEKFSKNGFAYVLCRECGTLFQSPRKRAMQHIYHAIKTINNLK